MTMNTPRPKPRRSVIGIEEERAWVSFYRRAGKDPTIAAEVLAQLDADAEMKREHLALYLCCREALHLQQAREARHRHIGEFIRWLLSGLFVRAPTSTARALAQARDMAMACLPQPGLEPAHTQVERMVKRTPLRASRTVSQAPTGPGVAAAPLEVDAADRASRGAKAAG